MNVLDKLQTAELTAKTSPDWDTPIEPLMRALERQLAAVVEYHGKQCWGDNWKQELTGQDKADAEIDLSLGPFFGFFERDAGRQLRCADQVLAIYREEIIEGVSIKEIRDDLAHGNKLRVAGTEDEYRQIRAKILELMKVLTEETPVAGIVERQLPGSYYLNVLWKSPTDTVIMRCGRELTDKNVYYFPPGCISTQEIVDVTSDEVVVCDDGRGLFGYLPTKQS